MFDIGWTEMLVVGVVAIIVVGPKDLPRMMRTVGNAVGKMRRMARDFQNQVNDAVREAELDDVQKDLAKIGRDTTAELNRGLEMPDVDLNNTNGATKALAPGNPLRPPVNGLPRPVATVNPSVNGALKQPAIMTGPSAPVLGSSATPGIGAPLVAAAPQAPVAAVSAPVVATPAVAAPKAPAKRAAAPRAAAKSAGSDAAAKAAPKPRAPRATKPAAESGEAAPAVKTPRRRSKTAEAGAES